MCVSGSGGSVAHNAVVHSSAKPACCSASVWVDIVVAEDEQPLAGTVAYVDDQAPIRPSVRVADVTQAG